MTKNHDCTLNRSGSVVHIDLTGVFYSVRTGHCILPYRFLCFLSRLLRRAQGPIIYPSSSYVAG